MNPNIFLLRQISCSGNTPACTFWKYSRVFLHIASMCIELIQTQRLWDKNAMANLLILHLCSSFKLSLALTVLSYLISLFLPFWLYAPSHRCRHEWGRILKCDLMSLVFLLSIFLPSTFCFLSLLLAFSTLKVLLQKDVEFLTLSSLFFSLSYPLGPYSVCFSNHIL